MPRQLSSHGVNLPQLQLIEIVKLVTVVSPHSKHIVQQRDNRCTVSRARTVVVGNGVAIRETEDSGR